MSNLVTVTNRLNVKAKRQTLNGEEYLVAPVSMIVEGVLNGSQGPLYYPQEELNKNPDSWNGIPIVVTHPTVNGTPVSARNPEVLNTYGVGQVFNAKFNGKLVAEAWFNVKATTRVDKRIITSLEEGKPIELSTGLFTTNEPAKDGATYNGTSYSFIARNHRPDHLAILPDEKGACSNKDGCGVLVNKDNEEGNVMGVLRDIHARVSSLFSKEGSEGDKGSNVTSNSEAPNSREQTKVPTGNKKEPDVSITLNEEAKKSLLDDLITNCDCWTEDDREVLNGFADEKLQRLSEHSKKVRAAKAETPKSEPAPTANAKSEESAKEVTTDEWLANAPVEVRSAVTNAMKVEAKAKQDLIELITANHEDDAKKQYVEVLNTKSLDELEFIKSLMPAPTTNKESQKKAPNYAGAATVPTGNAKKSEDNKSDDLLPLPVVNYGSKS